MLSWAARMRLPACGLLIGFMMVGCGSQDEVHERDFKFFVESDDDDLKETLVALSSQYHEEFGQEVISFTNDPDEANSSIKFIDGLKERENRIGLGQWVVTIYQEEQGYIPTGGRLNSRERIVHSMNLSFDYDNFKSKTDSINKRDSGDWKHLYHLFCHEVGHGLEMEHEGHRQSVMYNTIPDSSRDDLDFDSYFETAQLFFTQ